MRYPATGTWTGSDCVSRRHCGKRRVKVRVTTESRCISGGFPGSIVQRERRGFPTERIRRRDFGEDCIAFAARAGCISGSALPRPRKFIRSVSLKCSSEIHISKEMYV